MNIKQSRYIEKEIKHTNNKKKVYIMQVSKNTHSNRVGKKDAEAPDTVINKNKG